MVKPLVSSIIFWPVLAVVIIIVFIIGFLTSQQCIDISGCKSCWNTIDRTTQSEVCPDNQTCTIEPYVSQHNAVTDSLICACSKARTGDYPNTNLNNEIIKAYSQIYGPVSTVQEVCESGGLVKLKY